MTTSTSSTSSSTSYALSTSSGGAASISGLASGIDTTSLITSLMQIEAQPQTQLKTKLSTNQAQTSLLQSINTKLAALTTSASALSTGTALGAATATSSSTAIVATVTGTPQIGTLTVSAATAATASAGEFLSDPLGTFPAPPANSTGWSSPGAGSFAFSLSGIPGVASPVSLTATSGSAEDVAAAVNASTSGVKASVLYDTVGTAHLYLTSPTGTGTLSMTWSGQTAPTTAVAGQNASITVNGVTRTQASNTFTDVIPGLNLTVATNVASPQTVTTTANTSAVVTNVKGVVDQLASVLADIRLATTAPARGTTASATNGGLLTGNSTLREVTYSFMSTEIGALGPALTPGHTPADAGITTDANGVVSVDTTQLTTFLTSNPNIAQSVLTNFGTALSTAAAAASNPGIGTISQAVTTLQSAATNLSNEISDWDTRLAQRQATLQAQYTAMETALSKLQSQSNALTSALKQLEPSTS